MLFQNIAKFHKKRIGSRRKIQLHLDFECVDENPWSNN